MYGEHIGFTVKEENISLGAGGGGCKLSARNKITARQPGKKFLTENKN